MPPRQLAPKPSRVEDSLCEQPVFGRSSMHKTVGELIASTGAEARHIRGDQVSKLPAKAAVYTGKVTPE
jgi:hypothetical protein